MFQYTTHGSTTETSTIAAMSHPAIHSFTDLFSADDRYRERAMESFDMCRSAAVSLAAVNALPRATKGRLVTSLAPYAELDSGALVAKYAFGDTCQLCSDG